jgi:hypothetical protein
MTDEVCKNNRGKHGCQNVVVDGGVDDSGYCETCFYPGIVEKQAHYEELLQNGHSRVEAAEISGIDDRNPMQSYGGEVEPDATVATSGTEYEVPVLRYGTVPITNVEQDANEEDPEDEEDQEELTQNVLDRIEDQNDTPDLP